MGNRGGRALSLVVMLLLAAFIHFDWHLARPHHTPLSFEWRLHWLVAIPVFALMAWVLERGYPGRLWEASAVTILGGVFGGQVLEPLYENITGIHRFTAAIPGNRWTVFAAFMAAGLLTYLATVALLIRVRESRPRA